MYNTKPVRPVYQNYSKWSGIRFSMITNNLGADYSDTLKFPQKTCISSLNFTFTRKSFEEMKFYLIRCFYFGSTRVLKIGSYYYKRRDDILKGLIFYLCTKLLILSKNHFLFSSFLKICIKFSFFGLPWLAKVSMVINKWNQSINQSIDKSLN